VVISIIYILTNSYNWLKLKALSFLHATCLKDQLEDQPTGRPARPRTQHDCHHDTKVKPEAATAVIELLIMGGKTPETC
jgi:hypothetical protein